MNPELEPLRWDALERSIYESVVGSSTGLVYKDTPPFSIDVTFLKSCSKALWNLVRPFTPHCC